MSTCHNRGNRTLTCPWLFWRQEWLADADLDEALEEEEVELEGRPNYAPNEQQATAAQKLVDDVIAAGKAKHEQTAHTLDDGGEENAAHLRGKVPNQCLTV